MQTHHHQAQYSGPERRRNHVYLTENSEYHCQDQVCVAVRDRKTGQFLRNHGAIGLRMTGGIRFNDEGGIASLSTAEERLPAVGESLLFSDGKMEAEIKTSALRAIRRPSVATLEHYVH
jgi:hypothetical protein